MNYKVNMIKAPLSVQIELTYNCNNYCMFCYNVWKDPKDEPEDLGTINFEDMKKILEKLKESGVFRVAYTGGEPTLNKDFTNILSYGTELGLMQSFITNGNTMTSDLITKIKTSGVTQCQVSFHSNKKEKHDRLTQVPGSFNKVVAAIRDLTDSDFYVNVNMTVNKENMNEIFETASLAKSLGAQSFSITRFISAGAGISNSDILGVDIKDLNKIVDQIVEVEEKLQIPIKILTPIPLCSIKDPERIIGKMSKCDGGLSWCAISPAGDVRYCTNMNEVAGSLMENSIEDIWQKGSTFQTCRNLDHVPDECRKCFAFQYCGGGCRASSYNYSNGDLKAPDPCSTLSNVEEINRTLPGKLKDVMKLTIENNQKVLNTINENDFSELYPQVNGYLMVREEKEGILTSTNGSNYAILNEDGLKILKLCNGVRNLNDIAELLVEEYKSTQLEDIKKGLLTFVKYITPMEMLLWNLNQETMKKSFAVC